MEKTKVKGIGYTAGNWPLDEAKSTIMFIHGAGGSGLFWKAQVEGLSARANTIAIDLPGHGTSDGDGNNRIEDYARATVDFIQAVEAPKPILCGFSMGGAIAQQILLDFPDLARAGILVNSGAKMKVGPALFESIENDYGGFVEFICKLAAAKKTVPELVRSFRHDFLSLQSGIASGDFRACDRFDVTDRLASVTVPVLVITAEEDKLTPPKLGESLVKAIKNATRAHIMGAGHIAPQEKPDEVNAAILKFLDQNGL
jgi:pimeloyl-ACP methyl ester carboxylesterase